MGKTDAPKVGFWSSIGALPPRTYALELAASLVLGLPGASYLLANTNAQGRHDIAYDFVFVAAPLLGLVFAAFVLVVSLFSDSYVKTLIQGSSSGVSTFVRPFVVAIGLQLGAVVTCVTYRAVATVAPSKVEVAMFVASTILFLFAVFDVLAVTRTVARHGLTRALSIEVELLEEAARVRNSGSTGEAVPLRRGQR